VRLTERRLRVAYISIQPALVWDDGDEFAPGPEVDLLRLPLAQAQQMLAELPAQVARLAEQITARDDESATT
jgi:hypothetical protein